MLKLSIGNCVTKEKAATELNIELENVRDLKQSVISIILKYHSLTAIPDYDFHSLPPQSLITI